jgi:hypothetical protein
VIQLSDWARDLLIEKAGQDGCRGEGVKEVGPIPLLKCVAQDEQKAQRLIGEADAAALAVVRRNGGNGRGVVTDARLVLADVCKQRGKVLGGDHAMVFAGAVGSREVLE